MCGSTHVFFFFHSLTVNHASSLRESSMKGNDSELLDKYGGWKSGVSRLLVVQISVTHLLWMNLPLWKRVKSRAALQNYQTEGIICTQLEPYVWQIYKNQKLLVIVYLVEFMKSSVMSFHNGYNFFFLIDTVVRSPTSASTAECRFLSQPTWRNTSGFTLGTSLTNATSALLPLHKVSGLEW